MHDGAELVATQLEHMSVHSGTPVLEEVRLGSGGDRDRI